MLVLLHANDVLVYLGIKVLTAVLDEYGFLGNLTIVTDQVFVLLHANDVQVFRRKTLGYGFLGN